MLGASSNWVCGSSTNTGPKHASIATSAAHSSVVVATLSIIPLPSALVVKTGETSLCECLNPGVPGEGLRKPVTHLPSRRDGGKGAKATTGMGKVNCGNGLSVSALSSAISPEQGSSNSFDDWGACRSSDDGEAGESSSCTNIGEPFHRSLFPMFPLSRRCPGVLITAEQVLATDWVLTIPPVIHHQLSIMYIMGLQHPKWLQMLRGSVAPSRCRLGGLHQLALLRQAQQAAKPDHGLASQALLVIDSSSIHSANPVTSTPTAATREIQVRQYS